MLWFESICFLAYFQNTSCFLKITKIIHQPILFPLSKLTELTPAYGTTTQGTAWLTIATVLCQQNNYHTTSYCPSMGNPLWNPLTTCPTAQAEAGAAYSEMRYSHLGRIWIFLHVLEPDINTAIHSNTILDIFASSVNGAPSFLLI